MKSEIEQLTESLRQDAAKYFNSSRPSHGMDHTERVYHLSMHVGKAEGADLTVLGFAALLHDTGRLEQDTSHGQICHALRGTEIAKEILTGYGVESSVVLQVAECIRTHRFRDSRTPQSLEARILFDADKLDSIGAVGIGRAFLFAGEVGARLHNSSVDIEQTEAYTDEDTAYREFMVKLRHVKERMLTEEGKRLAEDRHAYMVDFFKRLDREVKGEF